MNDHLRSNRKLWNALADIHVDTDFYDVAGFREGRSTLQPVEIEEIGPVDGRSLLHLQCHFGLDTLSWARMGAVATGLDFSETAIAHARRLSQETGIPAEFVCADVYDAPDTLGTTFDIVYTGGGVLCWLPDKKRWAEVIARCLNPGGVFYIREFHPFSTIFDDSENVTELRVRYPYFPSVNPQRYEGAGSYADPNNREAWVSYEWPYTLSDVVNALIDAGLRLVFLHESPTIGYRQLPFMVRQEDGTWRLPEHADSVPLTFSIRAVKD